MKEKELDYILVPAGIAILGSYHIWLLFTIHYYPAKTIIGTNAQSGRQWVFNMMNVCVYICIYAHIHINGLYKSIW